MKAKKEKKDFYADVTTGQTFGRPTKCTAELIEKICEIVANTSKGLAKIIELNSWMPDEATIRRWVSQDVNFRECFTRAKEHQIQKHLDFNLEIVDEAAEKVETKTIDAMRVGAVVQAAKLRAETREKYAQLLMPKVYGPKAVIDDGKDKDKLSNLTPEEAAVRVSAAFALAQERAKKAKKKNK